MTSEKFEVFQDNAGYSWFHRERGLTIGNVTMFGNVAGDAVGGELAGDVRLSAYDHRTGATKSRHLGNFAGPDDHNAPALCHLKDETVLAMWQGHGVSALIHYQKFDTAAEPRAPEASANARATATYSNVFRLPGSDTIIDFHRGAGWNPNYLISQSGGDRFSYGGRLIEWHRPAARDRKYTGIDGGRPYAVYAQAGARIHFAIVEDHPRAYDNAVHYGYIEDGAVFNAQGARAGALTDDPACTFAALSKIFDGGAGAVAWVCDIAAAADNTVAITFSVQRSGTALRPRRGAGGQDMRYHYAHFDGQDWTVFELACAGTCLYADEDDYTGLVAINPENPLQVAFATNHCPVSNAPLRSQADRRCHYEMFFGRVDIAGRSVQLSALTSDSTVDNIRPVFTRLISGDANALFWMAGHYVSYTNYRTRVVGFRLTGENLARHAGTAYRPVVIDPPPPRPLARAELARQVILRDVARLRRSSARWLARARKIKLRRKPAQPENPDQPATPDQPAAEPPAMPFMPEVETAAFRQYLGGCSTYLEYGCGGSTLLAGELGVRTIYTVESDPVFLEKTCAAFRARFAGRAFDLLAAHVDVGPTGAWGTPVDAAQAHKFPDYAIAPWRLVREREAWPELVLIDGRFRVACFLTSLIQARPGTVILFDDYADRPKYHLVAQHCPTVAVHGRLGVFRVAEPRDAGRIMLDLLRYVTVPD